MIYATTHRKTFRRRRAVWLAALLSLSLLAPAPQLIAQSTADELKVTAGFADKASVAPDEKIELQLSRALKPAEGALAILIGATDVTSLCAASETALSYTPAPAPLPVGETTVTVYLVKPDNDWRELASFPLRVEAKQQTDATQAATTPPAAATAEPPQAGEAQAQNGGQPAASGEPERKFAFVPSLVIGVKSQFAENHFPDTNRPERPTFADGTLQSSIKTEMTTGVFKSQTQFDFVGSTFQKEALRFGELGNRAPQVDLSNYLMQIAEGRGRFLSGHSSFGSNRQLINNFASRGLVLSFPLGKRNDFSFAAMNGTSIVGFGNFFGLNNHDHQIFSGAWGFEFLKERPGGLRLETSFLDGRLLPRNNFNQANINDAEKSTGVGLRLVATDKAERLKLDSGFTRSRFTNPPDPLLNQGQKIVPVQETTRNARYVDLSYDILKDFALTKSKKATLTAAYHHEQVDPLFRSVAAQTLADRIQNQWEINAVIDQLNINLTHQRFNDNLADVPSILKSNTRRSAFAASAPLSAFIGDAANPSPFLPRVAFTYDRVHQFAAAIPVNGGFEVDLSTVPNQLSLNQTFTAEWQIKTARVGYRFNRSSQDNRQTGRELADLYNTVNGFTFGITPVTTLELNFDVSAEDAENREAKRVDRTWRFGFNANWQMTKSMSLTSALSALNAYDLGRTTDNFNTEFNAQWAYSFGVDKSRFRKVKSQFFIRFANFFARNRDLKFETNNLTKSWTFNTGLTFTFF